MKLFSGSSNKPLAERVAKTLGTALSPIDEHIFPDGERRIRITENVVGESTVVLQTASTPVDINYMELFLIIDGLKRSGAEFVTAVIPYFGYQRQDHIFQEGEAVSLEVIIKILEHIGVDRVVSFDMHSVRIPDLFHIPVTHLLALPLFVEEIKKNHWDKQDTVLVSPDMGGIARVKKLAQMLGDMPFASVEKNRDLKSGKVTAGTIKEGSITGKKRAILLDDMISSGDTTITSCNLLQKEGIEEIIAFATHAVFSKDAPQKLQHAVLKKIYVTDTVFVPKEKYFEKLTILSAANLIAQELKNLQVPAK